MRCPRCGHSKTCVKETRERSGGFVTRRRRECLRCRNRWPTIEQCEETIEANLDNLREAARILLGKNGDGHGN